MRALFVVSLCFALSLHTTASAHNEFIVDDRPPLIVVAQHVPYFFELLDLALRESTEKYGPYELQAFQAHNAEKERVRSMLKRGNAITVLWSTTSKKREIDYKHVPFNILKNLNEYRFLLIAKGQQEQFNSINSIEDLNLFRAGSGIHWQDTNIFSYNSLPVITGARYEILFKMLAKNRFDYIARGAYEIWGELEDETLGEFDMENRLMLHYNAEYYFFVQKDDSQLAERLEYGLKKADENGRFDKLFFSTPTFKKGWDTVHNSDRILLELETP
ncbi:MAG: hypothetical protein ACI93R_003141 [Flavobacteriales bacterium]|jgi:hypothetical protein